MSEPINNDTESTSNVHTSWLLTDRVDYLEQMVNHLLQQQKNTLEYLSEVITAVGEISDVRSEE